MVSLLTTTSLYWVYLMSVSKLTRKRYQLVLTLCVCPRRVLLSGQGHVSKCREREGEGLVRTGGGAARAEWIPGNGVEGRDLVGVRERPVINVEVPVLLCWSAVLFFKEVSFRESAAVEQVFVRGRVRDEPLRRGRGRMEAPAVVV